MTAPDDRDHDLACEQCARTFATWPDLTAHLRDTHGHDPE